MRTQKSINSFGRELRRLRTSYGMKLRDMEKASNNRFRINKISQWERGRIIPELDSIIELAEFFDVDPIYLILLLKNEVMY